eukprot:359283-Chlamydomonas_euryale.AAC.1
MHRCAWLRVFMHAAGNAEPSMPAAAAPAAVVAGAAEPATAAAGLRGVDLDDQAQRSGHAQPGMAAGLWTYVCGGRGFTPGKMEVQGCRMDLQVGARAGVGLHTLGTLCVRTRLLHGPWRDVWGKVVVAWTDR